VLPALTTPFENGDVAPQQLYANILRYERHGLAGYLLLGSTAEAVFLDDDERARLLAAARRAIPSGATMVAGVHAESTRGAIRQARQASDFGADAALVLTPHYFRDRMTDAALVEHYERIADDASIPLLLYNVPKFTGLTLPPSAAETLSRHPNVVGMKESSGDVAYLREIRSRTADDFAILGGHAGTLVEALSAGAVGGILAAAVAVPEVLVELVEGHPGTDALQRELNPQLDRLMRHGVPGLKAACDYRGLHGGPPRRPLLPADETARSEVRRVVDGLVEAGAIAREL
jgi:4-hydroxy-2-oxoglutarate aldolase